MFSNIDKNLLKKFKTFHMERPDVYQEFRKKTLQMIKSGRKKYSAWTVVNAIRWDYDLKNAEPFKINNDFIAIYARLFVYHSKEYEGFFEFRTMKESDRRDSREEKYRRNNEK